MRKSKDFTFSNGQWLVVWQANWDISMERSAIEEKARTDRVSKNGSGDPELLYFEEMVYADLAAASVGQVPSLEEAFRLSDEDLDAWHLAVAEVNSSWYSTSEFSEELVQVQDFSIKILSLRPSVLMKRFRLEQLAAGQPPTNSSSQELFRVVLYPRLSGCSIGDVPSEQSARQDWTVEELNVWYSAAKRMIPSWFLTLEASAEKNQLEAEQSAAKKKKRRARS